MWAVWDCVCLTGNSWCLPSNWCAGNSKLIELFASVILSVFNPSLAMSVWSLEAYNEGFYKSIIKLLIRLFRPRTESLVEFNNWCIDRYSLGSRLHNIAIHCLQSPACIWVLPAEKQYRQPSIKPWVLSVFSCSHHLTANADEQCYHSAFLWDINGWCLRWILNHDCHI